MTRPPQPPPYPGDPGTPQVDRVHLRRPYPDVLGRPMRGLVTIINRNRIESPDGGTVPPSSVRVDLTDGVLDVWLLPGTYQLKAQVTTIDGDAFVDDDTVTLALDNRR